MNTPDVLVPAGADWLLLTREQFEAAREAGRMLMSQPEPAGIPAPSCLLSANELAERFHIPRSTVYELRKAGKLEAVKMGRHLRFDPEKALASLQGRPTGSAPVGSGSARG